MTSETTVDAGLDELLIRHFAGKVVRKDLTKLVKEGANVPVFVLEYLLGSHCSSGDDVMIQEGLQTVKKILAENYVRPDENQKIRSLIRERGSYKIIDKVTVSLNDKRNVYEAHITNLGVKIWRSFLLPARSSPNPSGSTSCSARAATSRPALRSG